MKTQSRGKVLCCCVVLIWCIACSGERVDRRLEPPLAYIKISYSVPEVFVRTADGVRLEEIFELSVFGEFRPGMRPGDVLDRGAFEVGDGREEGARKTYFTFLDQSGRPLDLVQVFQGSDDTSIERWFLRKKDDSGRLNLLLSDSVWSVLPGMDRCYALHLLANKEEEGDAVLELEICQGRVIEAVWIQA